MPVFFFIDPEFLDDPAMNSVNYITLSYTFFKTGEEEVEADSPVQARSAVSTHSGAASIPLNASQARE